MTRKLKTRRFLVPLCAVVFGVIVCCIGIGKMQERTEFVGKVDPNSGYRCRFTVPASWQHYNRPRYSDEQDIMDGSYFVPLAKSPVRQWIETHFLLASRTAGRSLISERAPLDYHATHLSPTYRTVHIQGGYPEITEVRSWKISREHLRIDGYAATLSRVDVPIWNRSRTDHGIWLVVYLPDQATVYVVGNPSVSPDFEQMAREMQMIISSFHVEKVAVSRGSRR
jgi:hypothetical protein